MIHGSRQGLAIALPEHRPRRAPRNRRASQRLPPRPCRPQAPFATSGRFSRSNRPETPHGAGVSPGRQSQRRATPPKTVQKPGTHGKIGAHFLRNRPEPAGGRPRARPQQQTGARRPMRDSEDRAHDGFEGASRSACRLEARERELRPSRKNRGALGDESRNYLLYAKQPGAGCITSPKKHSHPRVAISRRRKSAISCLPNTTCPPTASRFAATSTTS